MPGAAVPTQSQLHGCLAVICRGRRERIGMRATGSDRPPRCTNSPASISKSIATQWAAVTNALSRSLTSPVLQGPDRWRGAASHAVLAQLSLACARSVAGDGTGCQFPRQAASVPLLGG